MNEKQILLENERKADRNLAIMSLVAYLILNLGKTYTVNNYYSQEHRLILLIGLIIAGVFVISGVFCEVKCPDKYFDYKKYYLAFVLLIVMGSYSLLYVQTMFLFPPIALGVFSRFYNKRFMNEMSLLTLLVLITYTVLSIWNGVVMDLNVVSLESGTILQIPEGSIWIVDALKNLGIDNSMYVRQYVIYLIIPYLFYYGALLLVFNTLSKSGNEILNVHIEDTREKAYAEKEMSIAGDIQKSMLPTDFGSFGGEDYIDIFASMDPAKHVGGDFYDFFMIDKDKICFLVGDVSGKDVPAALFMAESQTIVRNMAKLGLSPSEILVRSNDALNERNSLHFFVTLFLGILNTKTGELVYSNAGHNPPFIFKKNGGYEALPCNPNFVLGMRTEIDYETERADLGAGDRIFIYSDGLTDISNIDANRYGIERVKKFLNLHIDNTVEENITELRNEIEEFKGTAEQFDDITMLLVEVKNL